MRRGPQVMILQALEDFVATGYSNVNPVYENELVDDFKLSLRIKPSAGLFFTDGKYPVSADCDSVPYESNKNKLYHTYVVVRPIPFCNNAYSFRLANKYVAYK